MAILNKWVCSGFIAMVTLLAFVIATEEDADTWPDQSSSSRLNELGNIDKVLLARYLAEVLSRNPSYESPIPPGNTLQAKLQSYLNSQSNSHGSPMAKRDGYWVWMPAQGFVPIPKQNGGGSSKSSSHTKILRYG